jgi:hypothetical protein
MMFNLRNIAMGLSGDDVRKKGEEQPKTFLSCRCIFVRMPERVYPGSALAEVFRCHLDVIFHMRNLVLSS